MIATEQGDDLVAAVVRFCRVLRARGLPVTTAETIDATAALEHIDITDRNELHRALRIVLVSREEDLRAFDEVFEEVWQGAASAKGAKGAKGAERARFHLSAFSASSASSASGLKAPSAQEALAAKDLRILAADQLDDISRLARRLARRLVAGPSRRWRASLRGSRIDLRATIRRSLNTAGEPIELARRERRIRKTSLVLLCDVSQSMDLYARFLLQFVYGLQNTFARVESFVFATRLSRVTHRLRRQHFASVLASLGDEVQDWSGGTRIGESLETFERDWRTLVDRRTIVVVMSDGWETGDPAQLGAALARLRARAAKVIWLNPLLGSPDYRPLTGGMLAALPHIDVLAPVHNVESLRALVRHFRLGSGRRARRPRA